MISPREGSREQISTEMNGTGALSAHDESPFPDISDETHLNMRSGFDLKILYRHVSQLLASLDEQGDAIFLDPSSRNLLLLCSYSQPELRHMIESEVLLGTNEKVRFPSTPDLQLINRLILLNDKIQLVMDRCKEYERKHSFLFSVCVSRRYHVELAPNHADLLLSVAQSQRKRHSALE